MAQWDFTEAEIEYHLVGIRQVSCAVDPIEHAAIHPFTEDIVRFDFDNLDELMDRLVYIREEFMLEPEDVMRAIDIARGQQEMSANG